MEQWFFPDDASRLVIDPRAHVASKYPDGKIPRLPRRAVVYFLGKGLPTLEETYPTRVLLDQMPGFITKSKVIAVEGRPDVCFLHGGYGAPQAACTAETLAVLGVWEALLVGLAGGFREDSRVGDVLLPDAVWSEEGTSRHYTADPGFVPVDSPFALEDLRECFLSAGLRSRITKTATTDAVYRQTFRKEASWRALGCEAVDMETSAFLTVCRARGIRAAAALMISDRHPLAEGEPAWTWGGGDFDALRSRFLGACVRFALSRKTV